MKFKKIKTKTTGKILRNNSSDINECIPIFCLRYKLVPRFLTALFAFQESDILVENQRIGEKRLAGILTLVLYLLYVGTFF